MDNCGEYAASFVPRWGTYFSCVLPKGHEGEHRAGGTCRAHGDYVMELFGQPPGCPKWPECVTILAKRDIELEQLKRIERGIVEAQLDMLRFSLNPPWSRVEKEGSD